MFYAEEETFITQELNLTIIFYIYIGNILFNGISGKLQIKPFLAGTDWFLLKLLAM